MVTGIHNCACTLTTSALQGWFHSLWSQDKGFHCLQNERIVIFIGRWGGWEKIRGWQHCERALRTKLTLNSSFVFFPENKQKLKCGLNIASRPLMPVGWHRHVSPEDLSHIPILATEMPATQAMAMLYEWKITLLLSQAQATRNTRMFQLKNAHFLLMYIHSSSIISDPYFAFWIQIIQMRKYTKSDLPSPFSRWFMNWFASVFPN